LEKGYINEDIEPVAEEAALGAGMTPTHALVRQRPSLRRDWESLQKGS
jgi:hypothetical protein